MHIHILHTHKTAYGKSQMNFLANPIYCMENLSQNEANSLARGLLLLLLLPLEHFKMFI